MADTIKATVDNVGKRSISTDLWGVFFEDISSSADGGLASELVQNGAFEYNRADRPDWSNYTAWRKIVPEGSFSAFDVCHVDPVAQENPHYAEIEVGHAPVSLENTGFDGMVFRPGEGYTFSLWARAKGASMMPIEVALIGDDGRTLASTTVTAPAGSWGRLHATLQLVPQSRASRVSPASADSGSPTDSTGIIAARQGALRLTFPREGVIDIDFVSLEPAATYCGLKHFRPDLVEALADLHPRFMRFPGGCITHGLGLDNMYHWNTTIGPVEHRPHNFNVWGYHQSFRIGYFEYLCLCETIGAKPLPVLPAGVTCQNTSQGPVPIAEEGMRAYVDEVLALVEFCNGGAGTVWGAKRAELGHPEPFHLEYLGIGNEDLIDDVFENRFTWILDAVRAAYPEIQVVGTVGPAPSGQDYERGWAFARERGIPIVDEHSYQSPSWWFHNLDHYDDADREGPKVYLGEYGSRDAMLINALSEAAFMSKMEVNGDVVHMASYAPLFCKNGHSSWDPDLIYFDNEHVYHPYSYWVQRMFATTTSDTAWPVSLQGPVTLRRELPETIGLAVDGPAHADISDISVEGPDGQRASVPDVHYLGTGMVDTGLALKGDRYTIRARVTYYEGMWGLQLVTGDIHGKNHNTVSLGRGHSVQVVRDGSGYELAGTEISMDAVRPGTLWQVRAEISERGERMRLFIDGKLIVEGRETPEEPRRTLAVAQDSNTGTYYIRIVNALSTEADFDVGAIVDACGVSARSLTEVDAAVLTGSGPYLGRKGFESPTSPTTSRLDLSGGTYRAPAWSFSTLALDEPSVRP